MKKILKYLISIISLILILIGFFKKEETLFIIGFYLHFIDATYVSLEEYKENKKIKFNTIFYPIALGLFTIALIYQYI